MQGGKDTGRSPRASPKIPSVLAKETGLDPSSLRELLKDFKQKKSGVRQAYEKASSFWVEGELTETARIWEEGQEVGEWSFGQHPHHREDRLRRHHPRGGRVARGERKPRQEGASGKGRSDPAWVRGQQLTRGLEWQGDHKETNLQREEEPA